MNNEKDKTEYTKEAFELFQEINEALDTHRTGAILEAVSMILSGVISDLEMEEAIPILLEVIQDAILIAYDVDTDVISLGKLQ